MTEAGGPLRSWLFAPGNHARRVEKALAGPAHVVILDLEDAVAVSEKAAARANVRLSLAAWARAHTYVRINALSTPFAFADLAEIVGTGLSGVMLPMVKGPDEIRTLDWLLLQHERLSGLASGQVAIVPIIETAAGVARAEAIASASTRVRALAFGAGDFTLDLGLRWSRNEDELVPIRSALALASRVAGLDAPIDAAWVRMDDTEGMALSAARSRDHGFQGKLCIHPDQVLAVHEAYKPEAAAVENARRIVAGFEQAEAAGEAAVKIDGKMIDYPIVEAARRTLRVAAQMGM